MLESIKKEEYMTITIREVGARVVPFARKQETFFVPVWLANSDPVKFTVPDDCFLDEGITPGTVLICRRKFDFAEVTPGRLSIVLVDGEPCLRRVFAHRDGWQLRCGRGDRVLSHRRAKVIALVEIQQIVRH